MTASGDPVRCETCRRDAVRRVSPTHPTYLKVRRAEGIADKELPALLRRERLVPVVHGTTYDELEQVSLLLASRAGLNTAEESMEEVAEKIAELVVAIGVKLRNLLF